MTKKIFILFILISATISSSKVFAQQEKNGIKWMTLSEVEAAMQKKPKKIVVDVYTDWCYWCKRLDKDTYVDQKVIDYINKNYYAVKLNAEGKDPVTYRGKQYSYNSGYKMNTVAQQFMQGSNGYPTITFVNEKFEVINVIPGYQNADNFLKTAKYYGDNYYLNTDYETYITTIAK